MDSVQKLTMREWVEGSIEQRSLWLIAGRNLRESDAQVLSWALAFQNHGATITQDTMLRLAEVGAR